MPGCTLASADIPQVSIAMAADYPDQVAGMVYGLDTVIERLRQVGCEISQPAMAPAAGDAPRALMSTAVTTGPGLVVTPPSWRPDLTDPSDLAEEVIRLEGYERIPVRMPRATSGRGLTAKQRLRRTIGRALAGAGHVEVLSSPFGPASDADRLQLDPRTRDGGRPGSPIPIREEEPLLRTTLVPGLLRVLSRNLGRGFADLALFEMGQVFLTRPQGQGCAPVLRVDRGPTEAEVAILEAALPDQPLLVAAVLSGDREAAGWWGQGRPASWAGRGRVRAAGAAGQRCPVLGPGRPPRPLASRPVRGGLRRAG